MHVCCVGICSGGITKICMLNLPKSFIWILTGAGVMGERGEGGEQQLRRVWKLAAGFVSACLLIFRRSLNYRKIEPFIFLEYDFAACRFFLSSFFLFSLSLPLYLFLSELNTFIQRVPPLDFYSPSSFRPLTRWKKALCRLVSLCKFFLLLKLKTARGSGHRFPITLFLSPSLPPFVLSLSLWLSTRFTAANFRLIARRGDRERERERERKKGLERVEGVQPWRQPAF